MRRIAALLLICFAIPFLASAQEHPGGPPARMWVCGDARHCILVMQIDSDYVGLIEGGTNHAWDFHIDEWTLKEIKLTGTSTATDFSGRHQVVVMKAKPDVIKDGIASGKARYTVGHESRSNRVSMTWEVPAPKLTGLWVR